MASAAKWACRLKQNPRVEIGLEIQGATVDDRISRTALGVREIGQALCTGGNAAHVAEIFRRGLSRKIFKVVQANSTATRFKLALLNYMKAQKPIDTSEFLGRLGEFCPGFLRSESSETRVTRL
jgi:hypothetical protein